MPERSTPTMRRPPSTSGRCISARHSTGYTAPTGSKCSPPWPGFSMRPIGSTRRSHRCGKRPGSSTMIRWPGRTFASLVGALLPPEGCSVAGVARNRSWTEVGREECSSRGKTGDCTTPAVTVQRPFRSVPAPDGTQGRVFRPSRKRRRVGSWTPSPGPTPRSTRLTRSWGFGDEAVHEEKALGDLRGARRSLRNTAPRHQPRSSGIRRRALGRCRRDVRQGPGGEPSQRQHRRRRCGRGQSRRSPDQPRDSWTRRRLSSRRRDGCCADRK